MGSFPYGSTAAPGTHWPDAITSCSAPEIDGLLAGAGYRVRSSDLCHVAQSLERLESAMGVGDHLAPSEIVHYNPTDLAAWVDTMLYEVSTTAHECDPAQEPCGSSAQAIFEDWPKHEQLQRQDGRHLSFPTAPVGPLEMAAAAQEDSAIHLVHLLISCAESFQRGDTGFAANLLNKIRVILTEVNSEFGIGKVAGYFVDALCRRLYSPPESAGAIVGVSPAEQEILYHHFYEACPYLKFAHFTANQAILEAFQGHDRVHVVDFSLMHGLQWPALIQALALRPGGPPFLRLTGISPPSPDGRDALREVGLRLAELARSVHVRFAFRGVAAVRLNDVQPWMLQVSPDEALAVNSVLQFHRLLGDPGDDAPIDSVLGWIAGLKPKIVTVVEQEADHNNPAFLYRFTEALFYYSTMFDSLQGGKRGGHVQHQTASAVAEVYLQREICNIVCCEGSARVERHEPLVRWRERLGLAGLSSVHLGSNAFKQASMLLTLFSGEGYYVEETAGCLTLGWHGRPLIAASAWRATEDDDGMAGRSQDGRPTVGDDNDPIGFSAGDISEERCSRMVVNNNKSTVTSNNKSNNTNSTHNNSSSRRDGNMHHQPREQSSD